MGNAAHQDQSRSKRLERDHREVVQLRPFVSAGEILHRPEKPGVLEKAPVHFALLGLVSEQSLHLSPSWEAGPVTVQPVRFPDQIGHEFQGPIDPDNLIKIPNGLRALQPALSSGAREALEDSPFNLSEQLEDLGFEFCVVGWSDPVKVAGQRGRARAPLEVRSP
jgi:hypothetical protein